MIEKEFTDALQEFHQTITLIGIKETINSLKNGRDRINKEDDDSKLNEVKNIIISIFGNDCLQSKKEDINKSARCLFAYTLKSIGIKNNKIATVLNIHRNSVKNLVKHIKDSNLINPKVPSEIMLKDAYDKLNKQLNTK
jgi:hypothetical protein